MLSIFNIPHLITTYGYPGIFVIIFLESGIFFPLPGDSLLFTAGIFAGAFGLNIFFLVPMIALATFLGALAGYEVGRHLIKLQAYPFFRTFLKQEYIDKANEFFNHHGKSAILLSRFVPIIRTFVPIVAGVARMNYASFLRYSVFGAILWSSVVTLVGFFLGNAFPQIKNYMEWIIVLVVLVSVIPVILETLRQRKEKREQGQ